MGRPRPLAIDLYCGLGGWSAGLIEAGFEVVGFDIEDMFKVVGEEKPEHFSLVLQNVMTLHGRQFKDAALLVGSSPCQEFSYRAMPWKRAKALGPPELGMALFDAQFRIQREASEAAGRPIPLVVENVRGARPYVGSAKWNSGSMYFWGDVPALMPAHKHTKAKSFRFDGSGGSFQTASVSRWFNDGPRSPDSLASSSSSSPKRKAASAQIAKIPVEISSWIGKTYFPREETCDA